MTQKERSRQRYYDRKAKGLCQWCDRPAMTGRIRCEDHKRIGRHYAAGRYSIRKVKGVCVYCGKVKVEKFAACFPCRVRQNGWRKNRRKKV